MGGTAAVDPVPSASPPPLGKLVDAFDQHHAGSLQAGWAGSHREIVVGCNGDRAYESDGAANSSAGLAESINASGIMCGTVISVPYHSSLRSETFLHRKPYSARPGMNAAVKRALK